MTKSDNQRVVMSSLDAFHALRLSLAYLRSVSVIFDGPTAPLEKITQELRTVVPEGQSERDMTQMLQHSSKASICTHVSLLYAAVCCYLRLVEINPALRHDGLDRELTIFTDNGLLKAMSDMRNAVFHVRPSIQSERLLADVVRRTLAHRLALAKIERLLYDATEKVFGNPQGLFQEREEVLMQGFHDALDYYNKHLSGTSSEDRTPS